MKKCRYVVTFNTKEIKEGKFSFDYPANRIFNDIWSAISKALRVLFEMDEKEELEVTRMYREIIEE